MQEPDLKTLLDAAVAAIEGFRPGTDLWRHFDHGRIHLVGPWKFRDGTKWQAIADPYNATMQGRDRPIEGIGSTPEEALAALLTAIHEEAEQADPITAAKALADRDTLDSTQMSGVSDDEHSDPRGEPGSGPGDALHASGQGGDVVPPRDQ